MNFGNEINHNTCLKVNQELEKFFDKIKKEQTLYK